MSRKGTGSLYVSKGSWFLSLTLAKRVSIRLVTCETKAAAELRRVVIADIADRLKKAKRISIAESVCRQAAEADDSALAGIVRLVDGLVNGTERMAPAQMTAPKVTTSMSVRAFGELWTSNTLARKYRKRIKVIDHAENARKLNKHIYPVMFEGRTVGDMPLNEFSLDLADCILAQPTLPEGSVRHVAQCVHRLLALAVYPARLLDHSPLPKGWLPPQNPTKARSYLFPEEEAAFLSNKQVPVVRRLFVGFCAREGPRKSNVVRLAWSDLVLDLPDGAGYAVIDRTKSGEGVTWALDPGTAEALRRWRRLCPSDRLVFPAEAVPRFRRANKGRPMAVGCIAETLREGLKTAGVRRSKLFEQSEDRIRLRAHDLRATFVTLSLANGKSQDWVRTRTGHKTSQMIALYRREAQTVHELGLGWLAPLHESIPELAEIDNKPTPSEVNRRPIVARLDPRTRKPSRFNLN